MRPRLLALALLVLLAACGGGERRRRRRPLRPRAGQADHRHDPDRRPDPQQLQPGARGATVRCGASKVRVVEIGGTIGCTITLGDAVQKVTAEVRDLKGTVVVRG